MSRIDKLGNKIRGWARAPKYAVEVIQRDTVMLSAIVFSDTICSAISILASAVCLCSLIRNSRKLSGFVRATKGLK